jgi:hypothetical protein
MGRSLPVSIASYISFVWRSGPGEFYAAARRQAWIGGGGRRKASSMLAFSATTRQNTKQVALAKRDLVQLASLP